MKINLFTTCIAVCFFALLIPATAQRIEFIENKGQWHDNVKFLTKTDAGAFYIQDNGYKVVLNNRADVETIKASFIGHSEGGQPTVQNMAANKELVVHSHAYGVSFTGAAAGRKQIKDPSITSANNYFIGNDPAKWAQDCRVYSELVYADIYPGIDIRYYTTGDNIEYDFIVHPGADASKIGLLFTGVDRLAVSEDKLVIGTSLGDVIEQQPYSYQNTANGKMKIKSAFEVKGNSVHFKMGAYDKSKLLVIDPEIVFSSFTGSLSDNWGYAATYDAQGNFYSAGIVFGNSYPVSVGAYQTTFAGGGNTGENGGFDIGILKLNPNGTQRLYATYIGGSTGNELPSSLLVDAQDNLVVSGRTTSSNFPATGTKIGNGGGWDMFVCKLSSNGSIMLGSRVIGGSADDGVNIRHTYGGTVGPVSLQRAYGDAARSDISIDKLGNIYVGSSTQSTDFPTSAGAFQPVKSGLQDGVIIKFDASLANLLFASCLGGTGDDAIYSLVLSAGGDLYMAGGTASLDFPGNKSGAVGSVFAGGVCDGFLAKISGDGGLLKRTSFIGTAGADQVFGIDKDASGNIYIVGTSTGNMPVINAAFSEAGGKQFIAKLGPDFNSFFYSTVFGNNVLVPNIAPTAFRVDRCENVYVAGWGGVVNETDPPFPIAGTAGLSTTANALQNTTDGRDFYVFVLAKDAATQLYGSFFGQSDPVKISDHSDGGKSRFDKNGTLYLALCANCQGGVFPTTPGAWSTTNTSGRCNQAAVKIKLDFASCAPSGIAYVDLNAAGSNDGTSWEDAYTSLSQAIAQMNSVAGTDTILIATGTYTAPPNVPFNINKLNAVMLGGYPTGGGERNAAVNIVTIKGELRFLKSAQFDGFKVEED